MLFLALLTFLTTSDPDLEEDLTMDSRFPIVHGLSSGPKLSKRSGSTKQSYKIDRLTFYKLKDIQMNTTFTTA